MFQFAFEASLFRLQYSAPGLPASLFALPPNRATGARHIPFAEGGTCAFPLLLRNSPSHEDASGLKDGAAPMLQDTVEAASYRVQYSAPGLPAAGDARPPKRATATTLVFT